MKKMPGCMSPFLKFTRSAFPYGVKPWGAGWCEYFRTKLSHLVRGMNRLVSALTRSTTIRAFNRISFRCQNLTGSLTTTARCGFGVCGFSIHLEGAEPCPVDYNTV